METQQHSGAPIQRQKKRTFAKYAIARAEKECCGERFATAVTRHAIRGSAPVRGGSRASSAAGEAATRHGENVERLSEKK
jgi:hypothetical protein